MAQETNQTQGPLLCSNGCGFYGNRRNNGMCSVCYKDSLQRQNNSGRSSESASSSISGLGESVCVQLTSQHEQNSVCSGFSSSGADAHTDGPTAVAQPTLETQDGLREETTNKLLTVEENTSRGKRKLDETPQPSGSDVSEQTSDVPEQSKPKKNRCFTCRRKVGLTGFGCRCGHLFCSVHRYSDVHSCSFDYKADAAEKIRKENPVIVGEKIQKI